MTVANVISILNFIFAFVIWRKLRHIKLYNVYGCGEYNV